MRSIEAILCTLLLGSLAVGARAELQLPSKTIVVRDFSRRRQDLLDTLRVNLPDAKVKIQQFRGAEVVLEVAYDVREEPEDYAAEVEVLRKHCDGLIRRAYPGMILARESVLRLVPPSRQPLTPARLARIQKLRRRMPPRRRGPSKADLARAAERAGIESQLTNDPEALYQKALAEKLAGGEGVTPRPESAPETGIEAPLEITEVTEVPEAPSTEETGILLQRLQGSEEVSPEALAELQSFHRRRGLPRSSQKTVREIYAAIFAERHPEGEARGEDSSSPSPEASPGRGESLPPVRPAPSLRLDEELEALFESPREDPGGRLGISMVSFPAPDPSQ